MAQRLARRDWRLGGPRFKSHSRLTFQSWSSYQLNQLGSKAASDSTLKQLTTCGVSNTCTFFSICLPDLLYFILLKLFFFKFTMTSSLRWIVVRSLYSFFYYLLPLILPIIPSFSLVFKIGSKLMFFLSISSHLISHLALRQSQSMILSLHSGYIASRLFRVRLFPCLPIPYLPILYSPIPCWKRWDTLEASIWDVWVFEYDQKILGFLRFIRNTFNKFFVIV